MKNFPLLTFLIAALTLGSCKSSLNTLRSVDDDVYYTKKDDKFLAAQAEARKPANQSVTEQNTNVSSGSATYITNNYYYDYNDYSYTTRMQRFNNPGYSFGYYSPMYCPGVYGGCGYYNVNFNSYNQYSYYDPFFNPYMGYSPYSYNPYNYGYYNSPYSVYNNGYWDGFATGGWKNNGNNGNNSGGGSWGGNPITNTTYYGPRSSQGSFGIYNDRVNSLPERVNRLESEETETPGTMQENPAGGNVPTRQEGTTSPAAPRPEAIPATPGDRPTGSDAPRQPTQPQTRPAEQPQTQPATEDPQPRPRYEQPRQQPQSQPEEQPAPRPRYEQPRQQPAQPSSQPQPTYEQPKPQYVPQPSQPRNTEPRQVNPGGGGSQPRPR